MLAETETMPAVEHIFGTINSGNDLVNFKDGLPLHITDVIDEAINTSPKKSAEIRTIYGYFPNRIYFIFYVPRPKDLQCSIINDITRYELAEIAAVFFDLKRKLSHLPVDKIILKAYTTVTGNVLSSDSERIKNLH